MKFFFTIALQLCFRICIRGVQAKQESLKLNGTYQLLGYADYHVLLGGSICTIETEGALVVSSKEIRSNCQKTKYMVMS